MPSAGDLRKIRSVYHRELLNYMRTSGEVSVGSLAEKIRLSKPTTMKLLARYGEMGLVQRVGKGRSGTAGGKRPSLFRFVPHAGHVLSFHVLPDELLCTMADLSEKVLRISSVALSEQEGAQETVDKMAQLHREQLRALAIPDSRLVGVAIGAHGVTDSVRGEVITSPHFPLWGERTPLREMFRKKTGFAGPVLIDNQIRFQAYAEWIRRSERGKRTMIVIEAGVGLVAGIIVRDEIVHGRHYLAGEIGHMVLSPADNEVCACGSRGCFEVMVCTRRILQRVREGAAAHRDSSLFARPSASPPGIEDVFRESNGGDTFARQVIDETARWFALGLWNVVLAYDPEIIVIQGVFTDAGAWFLERLHANLADVSLPRVQRNVEIVYSELGKERCAIGAAALLVRNYLAHQAQST